MRHLRTSIRGGLAAVVTALLFFVYVPTGSATGAGQGIVVSHVAPSHHVFPDCCASAWYPWGWYYTKAKCNSAGEHVLDTVAVALAYACNYHSKGPRSAPR